MDFWREREYIKGDKNIFTIVVLALLPYSYLYFIVGKTRHCKSVDSTVTGFLWVQHMCGCVINWGRGYATIILILIFLLWIPATLSFVLVATSLSLQFLPFTSSCGAVLVLRFWPPCLPSALTSTHLTYPSKLQELSIRKSTLFSKFEEHSSSPDFIFLFCH